MSGLFKDNEASEFFCAVLSCENTGDVCDFFEDLCTVKELQSMIARFQVAKLLNAGVIYSEIVKKTGASTATISRVNRALSYGSDGYKKVLARGKTE